MDEIKDWMWLIKTNKGDFFITVVGKWTQEEAAKRVRAVFEVTLKLDIVGMIPRKRSTGPDDIQCTIFEQQEPKDQLGFDFLAGEKIWQVCGRGVEYQAQKILLEKELAAEREE